MKISAPSIKGTVSKCALNKSYHFWGTHITTLNQTANPLLPGGHPQQLGPRPGQECRLRLLRYSCARRLQPLPGPGQPALRTELVARVRAGQVRCRHGRDLPAGRGGPLAGSGRGAQRKVYNVKEGKQGSYSTLWNLRAVHTI